MKSRPENENPQGAGRGLARHGGEKARGEGKACGAKKIAIVQMIAPPRPMILNRPPSHPNLPNRANPQKRWLECWVYLPEFDL
jgi:hypothetical protein